MLLKDIIQRVQSLYSKGVQSIDSRLRNRHIYNKLLTSRAFLLQQMIDNNKKISSWSYQTVDCVEMEYAHLHNCDCITTSCNVLKSKYPIPRPFTSITGEKIQVSNIEGTIIFSQIEPDKISWQKGNRYAKETPSFFVKDNFLYITGVRNLFVVSLTGLFQDPVKVQEFSEYSHCGNNTASQQICSNPLDSEFPIESSLIDTLIELTVNELINYFKASLEDRDSNRIDDTVQRYNPAQKEDKE